MPLGSVHYRTSERMEAQARAFSVSPQALLQARPCSAPSQGSSVASRLEEGQWAALDMELDVGEDGGVITEPWGMIRPFFTPWWLQSALPLSSPENPRSRASYSNSGRQLPGGCESNAVARHQLPEEKGWHGRDQSPHVWP